MSVYDWEQLPYFLAVSRAGSLRAAAAQLGTTHVKVGRHLRALEASYGVTLVRRSTKGIELTNEGKHLLPIAIEIETKVEQARRGLQGMDQQMKGDIRFSASGPLCYYLVAPILASFSKLYPNINLIVDSTTKFEDHKLVQTDVSLRMVYEVTDDAIVKKLFPVGIGTYAHKEYISENFYDSGPNGEGMMLLGAGGPKRPAWAVESEFPNADAQHQLTDPLMFLELVSNKLGMARLAAFLTRGRPELQLVPGTSVEDGPPLCIITHPELRHSPKIKRFVTYLENEIRKIRSEVQGSA